MAYLKQDELIAIKDLMRKMYFSKETVEQLVSSATAGQIAAVSEMITNELKQRKQNKRARLIRKAKFPQIKSFEGYEFTRPI